MAANAPAHGQLRDLLCERHFVHADMAGAAPDALGDMNGVVEVDVPRQPVDAIPMDGLMIGEALTDRSEHFRVPPDL